MTYHLSYVKKNNSYFPLNPGWLIGILIIGLWKIPRYIGVYNSSPIQPINPHQGPFFSGRSFVHTWAGKEVVKIPPGKLNWCKLKSLDSVSENLVPSMSRNRNIGQTYWEKRVIPFWSSWNNHLVGGFSPTHLKKYGLVKLDHVHKFRGENNKYLSCHYPAIQNILSKTYFQSPTYTPKTTRFFFFNGSCSFSTYPRHPVRPPEVRYDWTPKNITSKHQTSVRYLEDYLEDHPSGYKWLITMVSFRPLTGVVPFTNDGLFMAYKWWWS